jgi:SdrD B-like protein
MRRLKQVSTLAAGAALLLMSPSVPGSPSGPTGAIFTTTPAGTVVNENVHYGDKREVYLDGGPPPNAPHDAAGLDDGCYVLQVTDPSGSFLLSNDPSRCRVVKVHDGVITRRLVPTEIQTLCGNPMASKDVPTTDNWADKGNGAGSTACRIDDDPPHPTNPGVMGASGRHDTNADADHWSDAQAIVVQLMPYGTTPNPGNVYKAWAEKLGSYLGKGGDINKIPSVLPKAQQKPQRCPDFCAAADAGFGPPRSDTKTDNFKVKAAPPKAELDVRKFHDVDYNGVWDDGEPEIGVDQCVDVFGAVTDCGSGGGWPISITDPTTVTNDYFTPVTLLADPPGIWTVDEGGFAGWVQSAAFRDGVPLGIVDPVSVTVLGQNNETHEVVFGNSMTVEISGNKFIDRNYNGQRDAGEGCPAAPDHNNPGCQGVTVHLDGTDNMGHAVHQTTTTDSNGDWSFAGILPGSYTITIDEPSGFECSFPDPTGLDCSYDLNVLSGDVRTGLDFGDFSRAEIHGQKTRGNDCGGDGMADVLIHLEGVDGMGHPHSQDTYTCGGLQQADCMGEPVGSYWFTELFPGSYTVTEQSPSGFGQSCPAGGAGHDLELGSDEVATGVDFGNVRCDGLTPGYWSNWRNHYTAAQFCGLLQGTVADVGDCTADIAAADDYLTSLGCDNGDALHCMRRFLLSDQLTVNLTASGDSSLFNEANDGLVGTCSLSGTGTLQSAIDDALAILADCPTLDDPGCSYTRDQVLAVKDRLAAFAELN